MNRFLILDENAIWIIDTPRVLRWICEKWELIKLDCGYSKLMNTSKFAEVGNQESGIRNQESGIRNQESGIRNQEINWLPAICGRNLSGRFLSTDPRSLIFIPFTILP